MVGADGPWSLTAKSTTTSAFGRYSDFKCMATASKEYKTLAKRYLRTFPQNEFMEDDAVAGYAYVKIVAEAISKVGPNSQRIAAYVHAHTFNIPGYAWPLRWTAWGEMIGSRPQYAILTKGGAARAWVEHRLDHLLAESAVQVAGPDPVPPAVVAVEVGPAPRG